MSNFVAIQNTAMPVVEYQGKRVVTFAMIDKAHGRKKGAAKRTFNRNKSRFVEGKDFFELTWGLKDPESLKGVFPPRTPKGILITEPGYLLLVKPFGDDLSWDVQRQMVDAYFRRNTLGELRHVEIPSLEELREMPPEKAQHIVAKAEKESSFGHGKPGSAAMTLRRKELKQIRPAIRTLIDLHQISICDLGDFAKEVAHA
ncbi:ORF6N domain-containing protein [Symbiopectobacterium sp. Eva_TO]